MIYKFGNGQFCDLSKNELGGKGHSLHEMARLGLNVPPGFTIPIEMFHSFRQRPVWTMDTVMGEAIDGMAWLKDKFGYYPLVSVRSGAPVSMPGLMDTILNVGVTSDTLPDWVERVGERTTLDSQRRLIQMLGSVALEIPYERFDDALSAIKCKRNVQLDCELSTNSLDELVGVYLGIVQQETGNAFPDSVSTQLYRAIEAVFKSWDNDRAKVYRNHHGISHDLGTAVNIQAMVFGNMNAQSGSGVLFTRNSQTGENNVSGEFLPDAQGEDVVAGIRTPMDFGLMEGLGGTWGDTSNNLYDVSVLLENHFRDMQDIEFTVQSGEVFILQCRTGKRTAQAAFRIAIEMMKEKIITPAEALSRVTPEQFKIMKRPRVDPSFTVPAAFSGLPACGGVATGAAVFTAKDAVASKVPCILITHETDPDDLAGMIASAGVLTATGGTTSHAAVVARSLDKTCITGTTGLNVESISASFGGWTIVKGSKVTICGDTGRVWLGINVPTVGGAGDPFVAEMVDVAFAVSGNERRSNDFKDMARKDIGRLHYYVGDWGLSFDKVGEFIKAVVKYKAANRVTLHFEEEEVFGFLDQDLLCVFSTHAAIATEFYGYLTDGLVANRDRISGMVIDSCLTTVHEKLKAAGYALPVKPSNFDDILAGSLEPSEEFIKTHIGSVNAWNRIKKLLVADGVSLQSAAETQYVESMVFSRLGK